MVSSSQRNEVISLYQKGKNFIQIQALTKVDRHIVPSILVNNHIPLRLPFQGIKAQWAKQYEKTPKGLLMRTYRNMQSRVTGIQHKKAHLYKGLSILSRKDFYGWAWNNPDFWRLHKQWVASGYERRLSPSINRIDTSKGYEIGNIEWLTHSVNSSLGGSSYKRHGKSELIEVFKHAAS